MTTSAGQAFTPPGRRGIRVDMRARRLALLSLLTASCAVGEALDEDAAGLDDVAVAADVTLAFDIVTAVDAPADRAAPRDEGAPADDRRGR